MINRLKDLKRPYIILATAVIATGITGAGAYYGYNKSVEKKEYEKFLEEEAIRLEQERLEQERVARIQNNKVAYLTFDDGPHASNTDKILNILEENNIKATFFVLGQQVEKYPEIVKRIYDAGHTIANHTTDHKYTYTSGEEFLNDIRNTDELISKAIGTEYRSLYVRVPGGSFGKTEVKEAIKNDGRIDLNWTALNGDSERKYSHSTSEIINRLDETFGDDKYEVVLMHDIKNVTAENLQTMIDNMKEEGYIFEHLVSDSPVQS